MTSVTRTEAPAGSEILGTGEFRYRVRSGWGRLPEGWVTGAVADVAVGADDRVFVFTRGAHPVLVFDREGDLIDHWGEDVFTRPHGLRVGPDGTIFTTDEGAHVVRVFTSSGRPLLTIGEPGAPGPLHGGEPFHGPTQTALTPDGDLLVADGHGNARVHWFSSQGDLIYSWGEPGSGRGEFHLPHGIACDEEGWVYVADRENHRIQVFDVGGDYRAQWNDLHRPSAIHLVDGPRRLFYVSELGPRHRSDRAWPNLGPRVSILDDAGRLLGRFGADLVAPHGIAVDSRGDVIVGDLGEPERPSVSLHRFERIEPALYFSG